MTVNSAQVLTIPKAGIRFGSNAYYKKLLANDQGKLNMGEQFAAGMGAGITEAINGGTLSISATGSVAT